MDVENKYGLKKLHQDLLTMAKEFDSICEKNDIKYSLFYGSLLGAVREKGFIQWDDDIDVVMTKEDLKKLDLNLNSCSDYYIDYMDSWVPRFKYKCGSKDVFIDLFTLTPISSEKSKQERKFLLLRTLQGMLKEKTSVKKFTFKQIVLLKTTKILGKFFSRNTKLAWYRNVENQFARGDGQLLHVATSGFRDMTLLYDKKIVNNFKKMDFEDTKLMVCENYEYALIKQFGNNYMTPPPEKDRIPLHINQK